MRDDVPKLNLPVVSNQTVLHVLDRGQPPLLWWRCGQDGFAFSPANVELSVI